MTRGSVPCTSLIVAFVRASVWGDVGATKGETVFQVLVLTRPASRDASLIVRATDRLAGPLPFKGFNENSISGSNKRTLKRWRADQINLNLFTERPEETCPRGLVGGASAVRGSTGAEGRAARPLWSRTPQNSGSRERSSLCTSHTRVWTHTCLAQGRRQADGNAFATRQLSRLHLPCGRGGG
jgi:hypothetical protein